MKLTTKTKAIIFCFFSPFIGVFYLSCVAGFINMVGFINFDNGVLGFIYVMGSVASLLFSACYCESNNYFDKPRTN